MHPHRLQDAVQITLGRNGLRHGGQRFHAFHGALRLFGQPRLGDHSAHLFADEAQQRDLIRRVRMRPAVMDVDDPDQFATGHQRHREERFEGILRQRLKRLEARIRRGIGRQGYDGLVQRHPPRYAFAYFHTDLANFGRMR